MKGGYTGGGQVPQDGGGVGCGLMSTKGATMNLTGWKSFNRPPPPQRRYRPRIPVGHDSGVGDKEGSWSGGGGGGLAPELADHLPVFLPVLSQRHLRLGAVCQLQDLPVPQPCHLWGFFLDLELASQGAHEAPGPCDIPGAPHKGVFSGPGTCREKGLLALQLTSPTCQDP